MRAAIAPLKGKYYETKVETEYGVICLAMRGWGASTRWADKPSHRQIAEWGKPDDGESIEQFHADMMSDGHYETMLSYVVAQAIEQALAKIGVP
jgi:hypothetical protein